jgi:hypothetical protein
MAAVTYLAMQRAEAKWHKNRAPDGGVCSLKIRFGRSG